MQYFACCFFTFIRFWTVKRSKIKKLLAQQDCLFFFFFFFKFKSLILSITVNYPWNQHPSLLHQYRIVEKLPITWRSGYVTAQCLSFVEVMGHFAVGHFNKCAQRMKMCLKQLSLLCFEQCRIFFPFFFLSFFFFKLLFQNLPFFFFLKVV